MGKKLIHFDEKQYKLDISFLEHTAEEFQKVVDKFNSLDIGEVQENEFYPLIFETENYLIDKTMAFKHMEVNGLKLSKQKFFELIEKPRGYGELISLTEKLVEQIGFKAKQNYKISKEQYFDFFELLDSVKLKPSAIRFVREKYEVHAHEEKTQVVYEFANKLSELLNETEVFTKVHRMTTPHQLGKFITDLLNFNYDTQKSTVKVEGVKRFDWLK